MATPTLAAVRTGWVVYAVTGHGDPGALLAQCQGSIVLLPWSYPRLPFINNKLRLPEAYAVDGRKRMGNETPGIAGVF